MWRTGGKKDNIPVDVRYRKGCSLWHHRRFRAAVWAVDSGFHGIDGLSGDRRVFRGFCNSRDCAFDLQNQARCEAPPCAGPGLKTAVPWRSQNESLSPDFSV